MQYRSGRIICAIFTCISILSLSRAFASTISTIAGGGGPDGLAALTSNLDMPAGVVAGDYGIYYVSAGNRVYAVSDLSGSPTVTVLAGYGGAAFLGDGGFARSSALNRPQGLALDGTYLYVADTGNHCVRRIDLRSGAIMTVAGNGQQGIGADSGSAIAAALAKPVSVAVDRQHRLYVADTELAKVYRISGLWPAPAPSGGQISRIAGSGATLINGSIGDGGPAVSAGLSVQGIGVFQNSLFVADLTNLRVRVVDLTSGKINTYAGKGKPDSCPASGPAVSACLFGPVGLAVNGVGDVFIGDMGPPRIWIVRASNQNITQIAGGIPGFLDGAAATSQFLSPIAVSVSPAGPLLIADRDNNRLRSVDPAFKTVSTLAGNGSTSFSGESGSAVSMSLADPTALAWNSSSLYIADSGNRRIRVLNLQTGKLSTFAGDGGLNYGTNPSTNAVNDARGLAIDSLGNLFISDNAAHVLRIPLAGGILQNFAGNGQQGTNPMEGPAGFVPLFAPRGIAINLFNENFNYLLIADTGNNRIRSVRFVDGYMTLTAGNGTTQYNGDYYAIDSGFNAPEGVAADNTGTGAIYIADTQNNMIRVVGTDGMARKIAGTGAYGFAGNGMTADKANFAHPTALLLDGHGGLLVADTENHQIRRIDLSTNIVTAFAGTGQEGYSGDSGDATAARLSFPTALAIDKAGVVYISDSNNGRIRAVVP